MKNKLNDLIGRRVIDIKFQFGRTGEIVDFIDHRYVILFDDPVLGLYYREEFYLYDDRAMINPAFKGV
jgi:hypothetical protein